MKKSFLLLPIVAILTACGGGDGGDSGTTTPPIDASLPSVISGELTEYNTQTGDAIVGAYPVNLSGLELQRLSAPELRIGMMLTLETDGQSTVQAVKYDDLLRAPVSSVDTDKRTLTMAGMTVLTENAVWANGLSLENAQGKMVEVSGYMVSADTIQATYLELELDSDEQGELEGIVLSLDSKNKTFMIGSVTVDYSKTYAAGWQNGDWVEVEGRFNEDGSLTAFEIERENPDYDDDSSMGVEGRVTWISSDLDRLKINGKQAVSLTSSTRYDRPLSAAAISTGMYLEIEGSWDSASKTLMAHEVELDSDDDYDNDDGWEPNARNEFELEGLATYNEDTRTVSINDFLFQITDRTEIEDLIPGQLTGNTWVSVSGYIASVDKQNPVYIALEVEREDNYGQIELEGVIAEDKTLWGYKASDSSLNLFTGYTNVECVYQGDSTGREVHSCQQDD